MSFRTGLTTPTLEKHHLEDETKVIYTQSVLTNLRLKKRDIFFNINKTSLQKKKLGTKTKALIPSLFCYFVPG